MLYILWGSKGDKWKKVCSLSKTMSTMWLTPWEVMKSHTRGCQGQDMHRKDHSSHADGLGNNLHGIGFQKPEIFDYCWILQISGTPVNWQAWVTKIGLSSYRVTCDNQMRDRVAAALPALNLGSQLPFQAIFPGVVHVQATPSRTHYVPFRRPLGGGVEIRYTGETMAF